MNLEWSLKTKHVEAISSSSEINELMVVLNVQPQRQVYKEIEEEDERDVCDSQLISSFI